MAARQDNRSAFVACGDTRQVSPRYEFPPTTRLTGALTPLLRVCLYGMPSYQAGSTLGHWQTHLDFVRRDRGRVLTVACALWSSLLHLVWRLVFGPPSAVLPGSALLTVSAGTAIIAFSQPGLEAIELVLAAIAAVIGALFLRYPRVQPRRRLAIAAAMGAPIVLSYATMASRDIHVTSDGFVVVGTAIVGGGMALLAAGLSPVAWMSHQTGRTWGFGVAALGTGVIAVGCIERVLQPNDPLEGVGRSLAALGTLVVAFTVWRMREIPQDEGDAFDLHRQL